MFRPMVARPREWRLSGWRLLRKASPSRELAQPLGVHEIHVSRDERSEYFGITLEPAVGPQKLCPALAGARRYL